MSYPVIKRGLDLAFAFLGLVVMSPLLLITAIAVVLESRGSVFFIQDRIGQHGKPFRLLKFRSMRANAQKDGLLTIGKDTRITRVGKFIRQIKFDELPQLINVLKGEMSLVGPRPEVKKYVDLYTEEQKRVLDVKPGITDLASIKYFEESTLLGTSDQPEKTYIEKIMPDKLTLNLEYIEKMSLGTDMKIIFRTIGRILS